MTADSTPVALVGGPADDLDVDTSHPDAPYIKIAPRDNWVDFLTGGEVFYLRRRDGKYHYAPGWTPEGYETWSAG